MSKNSNKQRLDQFFIWFEDFKAKSKVKKKQPQWIKEVLEDND